MVTISKQSHPPKHTSIYKYARAIRPKDVVGREISPKSRPAYFWLVSKPGEMVVVENVRGFCKANGLTVGAVSSILTASVNLTNHKGVYGRYLTDEEMSSYGYIQTPEGMKWCSHHQKYEPVSEFGPVASRTGGLDTICRQATIERDNTPEQRARFVIKKTLERLISAHGLQGQIKPLQFYQDFIAEDTKANPYARWRVDALVRMIENADQTWGRGNWQMDHGVALMRGGDPLSLNNLKPMPTKAHAEKSAQDVVIIKERRLKSADIKSARKELFQIVTNYCRAVPFLEWELLILGLADEDQEIEDLLADLEDQSPTTRLTPVVLLPSTDLIRRAKGLDRSEYKGTNPKANRPIDLRIDRRGARIKQALGMCA